MDPPSKIATFCRLCSRNTYLIGKRIVDQVYSDKLLQLGGNMLFGGWSIPKIW